MNNNNKPLEISVSFTPDQQLETVVRNAVQQHRYWLNNWNWNTAGIAYDKTMFYFTGIAPGREILIRNIINVLRKEEPGYTIRVTKRAGFDAMLTVTLTRRRSKAIKFFVRGTHV